ncbi:glycoside hydrolase family 97 N-terminal domain-containing protein, partial [candidate division KSB1 bacterium]|nr:glycoside hydrolase family 97 N-terminal domain-containing protein [candidate division KSB1 bacterium]
MIKPIFFSILLMMLHFSCAPDSPTSWYVLNPDNTLSFHLYLLDSTLSYSVSFNKTEPIPVLEVSPLGLKRQDQDFTKGLSFVSQSRPKTISETYHILTGKESTISYDAMEQSFLFENEQHQKLEFLVRAFADGVAFRYGFPETSDKSLLLTADLTGFNLPDNGEAWILPYSKVDTWAPAYETEWKNAISIGTPAPEEVGWSFPALFHASNLWIMLTEAGLDTTSFGLHLEQNADDGLYRVRLPEEPETYGVAPKEATIQLPWSSSWRTIVVGADPGTILETNIVTHLSAPCTLKDTSWIKPGRVSWSWWSEPSSPNQYDRLLPFIDLSAQLGWEYSLVDLGWHEMNHGGDIQDLIAYADSKGVGLILWY